MITPPAEVSTAILASAHAVIKGQAAALDFLSQVYDGDETVREQFVNALQIMYNCILGNGKIVWSAIGKSYKIADKISATMNSLNIQSVCLHPQDALHGDLGILRQSTDVLVMITSSGSTPELLNLLSHVPKGIKTICLTCTPDSPLGRRADCILSAQIPSDLSETRLYGLAAPTVTTTACLVVGDALAITLSEMIERDLAERKRCFGRVHPGGAIGMDYNKDSSSSAESMGVIANLDTCTGMDLLRACAGNKLVAVGQRVLRTEDILAVERDCGSWDECIARLKQM